MEKIVYKDRPVFVEKIVERKIPVVVDKIKEIEVEKLVLQIVEVEKIVYKDPPIVSLAPVQPGIEKVQTIVEPIFVDRQVEIERLVYLSSGGSRLMSCSCQTND